MTHCPSTIDACSRRRHAPPGRGHLGDSYAAVGRRPAAARRRRRVRDVAPLRRATLRHCRVLLGRKHLVHARRHESQRTRRFCRLLWFIGSSSATPSLASVGVPVLGSCGGEDARVNATIPAADSPLRSLGKHFEAHVLPGAGHGFLRQQDGQQGANMTPARQVWPLTIGFFRSNLGR